MADNIRYFNDTDLLYLITLIHTEFTKYVKIVQGKQLSTEDFTTALKTTLEGIKRTNENYGLSQEDFTTALLNKLNSIDIEELSNVQADFNQTDTTKDDYIKNKPNMTTYAKLNSPAFTGAPTAPDPDDNSTSRIATISYVLRKMSEIVGIKFEKVASYEALPMIGKPGTIYLVPKKTATHDIYTEYYYVEPVNLTYEVYMFWIPTSDHKYIITGEQYAGLITGTTRVYVGDDTLALSPPLVVSYYLEHHNNPNPNELPICVRQYVKATGELRNESGGIAKSDCVKKGGTEGFYEILGDTSVDLTGYVQRTDLVALTEAEVRAAWEAQFPPTT